MIARILKICAFNFFWFYLRWMRIDNVRDAHASIGACAKWPVLWVCIRVFVSHRWQFSVSNSMFTVSVCVYRCCFPLNLCLFGYQRRECACVYKQVCYTRVRFSIVCCIFLLLIFFILRIDPKHLFVEREKSGSLINARLWLIFLSLWFYCSVQDRLPFTIWLRLWKFFRESEQPIHTHETKLKWFDLMKVKPFNLALLCTSI